MFPPPQKNLCELKGLDVMLEIYGNSHDNCLKKRITQLQVKVMMSKQCWVSLAIFLSLMSNITIIKFISFIASNCCESHDFLCSMKNYLIPIQSVSIVQ